MHLIDSHAHLDMYAGSGELPGVLARAYAAGVGTILAIGIGDGPDTMHRALDLAHAHPNIWATAGIHPQEAHNATPAALAKLKTLAADPRCIAIGEIGLDYYHLDNPDIDTQKAAFVAQLQIAAELRKPITIHVRTSELATPVAKARYEPAEAWDDLLALLAAHWMPHNLPGIMHCFSGNQANAEAALASGFYLSFAGNLTYPRSTAIQAVAATAPADRILVETDAPFLTPVPLRGQRNEPAHVTLTAAFLANLRGATPQAIATQTSKNFHNLFPSTRTTAPIAQAQ
jgi:TatD DNase family protein